MHLHYAARLPSSFRDTYPQGWAVPQPRHPATATLGLFLANGGSYSSTATASTGAVQGSGPKRDGAALWDLLVARLLTHASARLTCPEFGDKWQQYRYGEEEPEAQYTRHPRPAREETTYVLEHAESWN